MTKKIKCSKFESQTDRYPVLDVLKGICIIFVIITHYGWGENQRLYGLFPYTIDMAVPVFMIISGYVFANAYIKKGITHFEDSYDISIILKRIIRYTLPFLIAYIIELLLFYFEGVQLETVDIIAGFFLGGFGPGSYYFPIMIQITFFLPIILFSMYKNPRIGLVFWFVFNAFYEFIKTLVGLDQSIYRLSLFRYTFILSFGCFLFLQKNKKINKALMWGAFAIGFSFILITQYLGYKTRIINTDWSCTSFMVGLYIAPIVMLIIYKFGTFSFKILEIIGKASYNIFLTQLVYYSTASGYITKYTDNIVIHVIFNIAVCVLAGILFYLIENRITKKIINLISPFINKIKAKSC